MYFAGLKAVIARRCFGLKTLFSTFKERRIKMSTNWINTLKSDLKVDEGEQYEIYNDHLGNPTFGIGHLIVSSDPEYKKPIGTKVSKHRVDAAFDADLKKSLEDSQKLFSDFDKLPDEAKVVIGNMMFNLGFDNLSKFKKFGEAIRKRDWKKAAEEMKDSLWYTQVTKRADRLIGRIMKLAK